MLEYCGPWASRLPFGGLSPTPTPPLPCSQDDAGERELGIEERPFIVVLVLSISEGNGF